MHRWITERNKFFMSSTCHTPITLWQRLRCEGKKFHHFFNISWNFFPEWLARLVHVFKNWKLLFENIFGNTCGWKSALKYVKCCLKTENCCLKSQTKHPLNILKHLFAWYARVLEWFKLEIILDQINFVLVAL